jgi:arsenate reductase
MKILHYRQIIREFEELLKKMDVIITLCDNAAESCPLTPPGIKHLHWSLLDPAKAVGTEEEIMNEFRKVIDEIKDRNINFLRDYRHS